MGIHNYDKMYETTKKRVRKAKTSERNKQLILEMNDFLILENLSKPRLIKYLEVLKTLSERLGKDFEQATEKDLKKLVGDIQQQNYSAWTKQTYKVILRRFYKWLKGTKDYPEIVSWISIRISKSEKKLPSEGDLLNEKDIQKLLETAEHPRDKAFVSMLWESGARIGEVGNLKIKNVVFDEYGTVITVQGKTGSRKIRLIASTPFLATWVEVHHHKDNNAPLWINIGTRGHNKPMGYQNMGKTLQLLFKKAGINKKCNPHLFRHSRATFMANHLTEFQMNQYFGWIQGSDMPATYVHMSGKEVDNAILKMNGFAIKAEEEESKIQPIKCPRCDTINSNSNKHCLKCGGILDIKVAMELQEEIEKRKKADDFMSKLLQDHDVQKLLMEKLKIHGGSF